jgi:hypothetical protein
MLLRKLVAALCPLLLCLLTCILFRWLDGLMKEGDFFLFVFKGLLLGLCVALLLPVAGITTRSNGLMPWLFVAAGVLALLLFYQYLETLRVVSWPALKALISINGQVVLAESAVTGFLLLTGFLGRRR